MEVWSTGTRRRPCVWGAWGFLPTQVKLGALFVAIDEEYFDQLTQPLVCLHPRPGRSRRMAESRSRYTYSAHPGTSITRSRPTGPGRSGAAQTAVSELHPPNSEKYSKEGATSVPPAPVDTPANSAHTLHVLRACFSTPRSLFLSALSLSRSLLLPLLLPPRSPSPSLSLPSSSPRSPRLAASVSLERH